MANEAKDLKQWVFEALELGFRCIGDGDRTPFYLLIADDARHLVDLTSPDGTMSEAFLEGGRALIRQYARSGQYYVLVWDGYLTMQGKKEDAVFAEAGESDAPSGLLFAQRYKQTKSGKLSKIGKPAIAAEVPHLWKRVVTKTGKTVTKKQSPRTKPKSKPKKPAS